MHEMQLMSNKTIFIKSSISIHSKINSLYDFVNSGQKISLYSANTKQNLILHLSLFRQGNMHWCEHVCFFHQLRQNEYIRHSEEF